MKIKLVIASILLFGVYVAPAQAAVIQSTGAGSAVTILDASADFESMSALFDNPYIENGLSFSRSNLSFNNNGCGFDGCTGAANVDVFGGTNFMYGTGANGYFEMATTGSNLFSGLEFITSTGTISPYNATWIAYLNGSTVGSGYVDGLSYGAILGFSDAVGFDTLRYTVTHINGQGDIFASPMFDSVRAEYISPVPIPAAIDIKPGSDPNCFNANGHGVIPVAILGSDSFDVTEIAQDSLSFGGLEVQVRGNKGPLCQVDYSDGDEYLDLVCQFEDNSDYWSPGEGEATLTGSFNEGGDFEGTDSICIVP